MYVPERPINHAFKYDYFLKEGTRDGRLVNMPMQVNFKL